MPNLPGGWDPRLDRRGTDLVPYRGQPGDLYYRLISGQWLDVQEARGNHHVFVEVLDESGRRMVGVPVILENGGRSEHLTEAKPKDDYAAAPPLYNPGHAYRISVAGRSDAVTGLGLGNAEEPERPLHTGYRFVFQLARYGSAPTGPGEPVGTQQDWLRALALVDELRALALKALGSPGA